MRQPGVVFLLGLGLSLEIPLGEVSSAQAAGRLGPGHLVLAHCQPEAQHELVRQRVMRGRIIPYYTSPPPPVRLELPLTRTGVTQLLAELDCGHKVDSRGAGESESLEVTTINDLSISHFLEYN